MNRVPLVNTGNEKTRVSVAFAATANGTKLQPIILIPRKKPLRYFDVPENVRVVYGTKGTFNSSVIREEFINKTLKPYRLSRGANKLYLLIDQSTCHLTKECLQAFKKNHVELTLIPKRLTSMLQPADVAWLRPLKVAYHAKWTDWMINAEHTTTPAGNLRSPGLNYT